MPGQISDPGYVRIFDTTLRDGEQSPGATLTSQEKLAIARQLAKMGVDIIEAGFPIASRDDFAAVSQIARLVGNETDEHGWTPVICGLSRTKFDDIDRAWEAVKEARNPRVHTFIATSEIHMQQKLRMTPDEVVASAVKAVEHIRGLGCSDIEFSPEDAGRSDPVFLYRILAEVIKAGATTLNIPDTTGWNMPSEFGALIAKIRDNTPGADGVVISTHCQNDLGLSTANSLAGAVGGARQLECTINGIGERAGNASLEEIVMAIKLRGEDQLGGLWTGIETTHIAPTSRMVSEFSGMVVQPHKAIVGANAFAHESGIHQDGMLKSKDTYEIMSPETIGLVRQDDAGIVLGKHSGRHAVRTRLEEMGYPLEGTALDSIFERFKDLADKKKGGVVDSDLEALVTEGRGNEGAVWEVLDAQIVCGTMGLPTATVKMRGPDMVPRVASAVGTGPVDAATKAVDSIVGLPAELTDYRVNGVTEGIDALAQTRIVIAPLQDSEATMTSQGRRRLQEYSGVGSHSDIVVSSTRAYVSALNKLINALKLRQEAERSAAAEEEEAAGVPAPAAN